MVNQDKKKRAPSACKKPEKLDPSSFPKCERPKQKKSEVFELKDYAYVDDYVKALPDDVVYLPLAEAAQKITNNGAWADELASIRAIFVWMVAKDHKNLDPGSGSEDSASKYYQYVDVFIERVAELLVDLCMLVNIPCELITGYKRIKGEGDQKVAEVCWNAVYVAEGWRFIYPGAMYYTISLGAIPDNDWQLLLTSNGITVDSESQSYRVLEIFESNFLSDPDDFLKMHYPKEDKWQLSLESVDLEQFMHEVLVYDKFFEMGLSFIAESKTNESLITKEGKTEICFGLVDPKPCKFEFCLYASKDVRIEKLQHDLDKCVMYVPKRGRLIYRLRFPLIGRFKFEILGDLDGGSIYSPCVTYNIDCHTPAKNCQPLPDTPKIGWGPSHVSKDLGIQPITHEDAEVKCQDGQVSITLGLEKAQELQQQLKHSYTEDMKLKDYCVMELGPDRAIIHTRLPAEGEYALELFTHGLDGVEDAKNALNYLIEGDLHACPFPNVPNGLLGNHKAISGAFNVKNDAEPTSSWITVEGGNLDLQFTADEDVALLFELHSNDAIAAAEMVCKVMKEGSSVWRISLSLPVKAEYALNVFARKESDESTLYNAYSYIISTLGDGVEAIPREGAWANRVIAKTIHADTNQVRFPIETDDKNLSVTLEPRLGAARIPFGTATFNLSRGQGAVIADDLKDGCDYIVNLYKENPQEHTVRNISRYHVIKTEEKELPLEKLKNLGGEIEAEGLHEVCSYNNPPDGVFPTLKGAMLLLGYPSQDYRSWVNMQAAMRGDKATAFMTKLLEFNPRNVDSADEEQCRQVMTKLNKSRVRVTSPGGIKLYLWVHEALRLLNYLHHL